DSMYFIPQAHADEAMRLRQAVTSLGECRLDAIPLLDFADQRDLIIRTFQEDTEEQMASLAGELQLARGQIQASTGKPSAKAYARLRKQYDDLMARTNLFVKTLDDSVVRTTSSPEVVMSILTALSEELMA